MRAVLAGALLGALLAAANVYTGLKTAYVDGGNITASVLSFAAFAALGRRVRPYSALETNLTQTVASSAAVMSMTSGVAGPIPALALAGYEPGPWALTGWALALALIGTVIALALRSRLIERAALPFPTGAATAEVIVAMSAEHGTATRRARTLLYAASFAALITLLRDGPGASVPQELTLGAGATLALGLSVSPVMLGTGLLTGLSTGTSMLAGSATAWLVLAPLIVASHWVAGDDHGALVQWLMWPGAALVLSSSVTSLLGEAGSLARGLCDVRSVAPQGRAGARTAALFTLLVGVGMVLAIGHGTFGLGLAALALSLALSFVLAIVCARSAGETDVAPVGTLGGMTQIAFGAASPVASLAHGSIVAGDASQTAATLWALKTGARLGASVRVQTLGMLIGAVVGALVVVPVYALVRAAYVLGSERMPAPGALSWKATADAVAGGAAAMPPYAPTAALLALGLGALLTLLARTRIGRFVPSPVALGIAFLLPLSSSATLFVGGALHALLVRHDAARADEHVASLAGGLIAGESLLAVLLAALLAAGLLPPT